MLKVAVMAAAVGAAVSGCSVTTGSGKSEETDASKRQKIDAARARTALDKARDISREHTANVERSPVEQVFLGPSL